jgi:hypothetical protein
MKNVKITWKASFLSALVLIVISLILESASSGKSFWDSIVVLPFLPLGVFEAIFAPFYYWVGSAFSTQGNPNGPMEGFIASLCALFALILIVVGIIDLFRKKSVPVRG